MKGKERGGTSLGLVPVPPLELAADPQFLPSRQAYHGGGHQARPTGHRGGGRARMWRRGRFAFGRFSPPIAGSTARHKPHL
jgi:hypothetical protein